MAKDMTEGSPARLILFFTLPLIAGNIMQQLYAFIDTLLVGRFLGLEALAAVGCTGSLMFLLLGFVIGLTSGLAIYTGQRYGAKDATGVRESAAACIALSFVIAVFLSVVGFFACRPLLELMHTPEELLDNATAFFSIICGGAVFATSTLMAANILRSLGDSKMPTFILGCGIAINIVLELLFLLVFGWGVPGAALATVVSRRGSSSSTSRGVCPSFMCGARIGVSRGAFCARIWPSACPWASRRRSSPSAR